MTTIRPEEEPINQSHLGSLYGPISRIRDGYGWANQSFARPEAKDYPAWRKKMHKFTMDKLGYLPPKCDLAPETVEKVDCGSYIREKIYFSSSPELRVPGYLLVPKKIKGKAPAILALHDHGGAYRFGKEKIVQVEGEHQFLQARPLYGGRAFANDLAEQGYVVLATDMFFWGERRMRLASDVPPEKETIEDITAFNSSRGNMEQALARALMTAGSSFTGIIVNDDMRSIDYLLTRPEVDGSRIGAVGLSGGGWRAANLVGLDERVKAAVPVCWLSSFKDIQAKNVVWMVGFQQIIANLYRTLDMPDVVSMAAPRALFCMNGYRDVLFPVQTGVVAAYKTLETVYGKLGAADKFRGHLYDVPHEFNLEMQKDAWEWFRKHL